MTNITAETKSHQKLRSRIQYLQMHLQTVDVALLVMRGAIPNNIDKKVSLANALGLETGKYSELNHPVNEKDRIINYSRAQNSEYAVITLYRYFTEYLHSLLKEFMLISL